ncbi:DUF547 domain-containing protein [Mucilaginibacter sp. RB4R14]|uniref:DUF547 domain-containing protein n=1 Tax=Mucilaginibacter aurantiaciroseus TaxID=2949308 RepID=UPI0020901CE9|nr:DUF547 domain-containing protein [Mucilaginibacter aurantiaciroseus]MCO5936656.1 DUF547 domain-containing protein [Mucilaginibacter aurantiaciroseus]
MTALASAQLKRIKAPDYIQLSQNFLYAAKTGDSTTAFINTLKNADQNILAKQLNNDHKKLAFWLNLYNGFTQVILKKDPDQYKTRGSFFSSNQIYIAGQKLSLDLIEHGILRHSKVKWSEGYLDKLFPSGFERKFRVETLDYRIHFALNCGAKSCPPIAFYEPEQLEKQLNVAVKTYLKGEVTYDKEQNTVDCPALMGWFRHDFGGKKVMLALLIKNKIIPEGTKPTIHFKKYDWSLYLNNYKSENNG